jgi:channel protein (hemolysin III family)
MLRLDVAAIFVLIASTFTIIHGILFNGWKRWGVVVLQWTIAVTGLTLRAIFFHQIPRILGDGIFLLMGWVGAYSAWLLWKDFGWAGVSKVIWGGVFYTIGVAIHSTNSWVFIPKVWGPHETFHLLVLVGLAVHWTFVWEIVDGSFQRKHSKKGQQLPLPAIQE